jgi:hypothetical protein
VSAKHNRKKNSEENNYLQQIKSALEIILKAVLLPTQKARGFTGGVQAYSLWEDSPSRQR